MDKWSSFLKLQGECATAVGLDVRRESLADLAPEGVSRLYCSEEIGERTACAWLWIKVAGLLGNYAVRDI